MEQLQDDRKFQKCRKIRGVYQNQPFKVDPSVFNLDFIIR
jgi:hypothetical protein